MSGEASQIEGLEGTFAAEVQVDQKERTITTRVKVTCGASEARFEIAGQTIGAVRQFLCDALNIGSSAQALVNGAAPKKGDNHVLKDGDELEFIKQAGKKG